ncbi:MAG: hypothetical protein M5U26_16425 [Planctomycetota bacterium]|nr:hypothetical protein [Planctomycetota bacterium]
MKRGLLLWLVLGLVGPLFAEDAKPAFDDATKAKVAALVKDLGSEEFAAREDAEKGLKDLGASILPLLKDAAAKTDDTEVRTRLERLIQDASFEAETDPDKLAELARKEARAQNYEKAEKLYRKAAAAYRKQAEAAQDEAAKKDLAAKAEKAAEREKRAQGIAKTQEAVGNVQVIGGGNAQVRIMVAGAGGGGRVVVMGGDGNEAGDDW